MLPRPARPGEPNPSAPHSGRQDVGRLGTLHLPTRQGVAQRHDGITCTEQDGNRCPQVAARRQGPRAPPRLGLVDREQCQGRTSRLRLSNAVEDENVRVAGGERHRGSSRGRDDDAGPGASIQRTSRNQRLVAHAMDGVDRTDDARSVQAPAVPMTHEGHPRARRCRLERAGNRERGFSGPAERGASDRDDTKVRRPRERTHDAPRRSPPPDAREGLAPWRRHLSSLQRLGNGERKHETDGTSGFRQ